MHAADTGRARAEVGTKQLRLPDFVVIGAMKAGTTSLHYYLSLHPEIEMSREKEPTFFTDEGAWDKGLDWYAGQFAGDGRLLGEASPDYTKSPRHSGVAERLHALLPDAKLIYLVRDPIERLISHYVDAYSFGRVHAPLEKALDSGFGDHLVACSSYHYQLSQYLPYFPPERILVVSNEELAADPVATLGRLFEFLEVDTDFHDDGFENVLYRSADFRRAPRVGYAALRAARRVRQSPLGTKLPTQLANPLRAFCARASRPIPRPELGPTHRRTLEERLRPDATKLRELTGQEFAAWSV